MDEFIVTALCALGIFVLYFLGMGIRVLIKGDVFRGGGCGKGLIDHDHVMECGVCPKKKVSLCESDDETGLAGIAEVGTMGRFDHD